MTDCHDLYLFAVYSNNITAFEREYFEQYGDSIHVFAGHLVHGVQAFADFEYACESFFDFPAEVLQVVLV